MVARMRAWTADPGGYGDGGTTGGDGNGGGAGGEIGGENGGDGGGEQAPTASMVNWTSRGSVGQGMAPAEPVLKLVCKSCRRKWVESKGE